MRMISHAPRPQPERLTSACLVFVLLFFLFFDFATPSFDFALFDVFLVFDLFLSDAAPADAWACFDLSVFDFDLLPDFDLLYLPDLPPLQFKRSCPLKLFTAHSLVSPADFLHFPAATNGAPVGCSRG